MKTLTIVLAVLTGASLSVGCSNGQTLEAKPARPVKTHTVALSAPSAGIRYSVSIEPFDQVPLAFKTSGYIAGLLQRSGADGRLRAVQPGDRVQRGTVLAHINDGDYRQRLNQAQARVSESEASLTRARLDLERARILFAADSLTKPDLDAAQAAFEAAHARTAAARADIEVAVNALRDCALTAPSTGTILERRVELGSLVGQGTVGLLLGDVSSVKARFGVPDSMIQSLRPGEAIDVIVEAVAPTAFAGRVTAIAPTADPQSRVFDVEVTIPNRDGRLRPGMIGTVAIGQTGAQGLAATQPTLTVPLTAVVKADGRVDQYAVLIVERQGALEIVRLRRVELGEVTGNGIAVLDGVKPGERVVVSGATLLVDGEAVRIVS
jgi:membrane fusion protein, multidrug efflux system